MGGILHNEKLVFRIVILFVIVYSAFFLYRISFVIGDGRYFTLFDDAMISMTYAKNLAHGDGLVWNAGGEAVEGYTNPLWVLYMALVHLIPIPLAKTSLVIELTGLLLFLITLFFVRKIAFEISKNDPVISAMSVLFTGLYYPLLFWHLSGMEVSILTLIVAMAVHESLKCLKQGRFPLRVYLLLGFATLIRIDMAVTLAGVCAFFVMSTPGERMKNLLAGILTGIVFLGVQTAFRLSYYGDILPNTYYLKMTGMPVMLRIAHGAQVYMQFMVRMNILLFALPILLTVFRNKKENAFLAWLVVVQSLYSIYVGGDSWEDWGGSNRFLSIVMPLYFVLFSVFFVTAQKKLAGFIDNSSPLYTRLRGFSTRHLTFILVTVCLLHFNCAVLCEFLMIKPPFQTANNREMVQRAIIIRHLTVPGAKVAVTWAGAIPYFSERDGVDMLGKCDRYIAHTENKICRNVDELAVYKPGHTKWDYRYTFKEEKPDIVPRLWGGEIDEILALLNEDYNHIMLNSDDASYDFWIRKDSQYLNWNNIKR